MAETTKKKTKSRKTTKKTSNKSKETKPVADGVRKGPQWEEAFDLECRLENKLLEDAILSAKLALQELEEETRKIPYERRSGLRLKEKAVKTERAFNRLRALRRGELIPNQPDE